MLIEQGQLLGRWWRFQLDLAAIADVVQLAQPGYLAHRLLRERRRQVGPTSIRRLIAWDQLRPVFREHAHEVLARAVAQVQHAAPKAGRPSRARGLDDRLDAIG